MQKVIIFMTALLFIWSNGYAQLTNTTYYEWASTDNPTAIDSRQTNLTTGFYKFVVTYNNSYLDLMIPDSYDTGHRFNNVNNIFPGTTHNLDHYILNIGSTNENLGVSLRLGTLPVGITATILTNNVVTTQSGPINSGSSTSYRLRVNIPANYQSNSFNIYITNTGSTNGSPFPHQVVVRQRFIVVHQDVLVERATDGIHTVTVFDGTRPLGNMDSTIYVRLQNKPVSSSTVKLFYDVGATPDGANPNGSDNRNRSIRLHKDGDYWVGIIPAADSEIEEGNIVNFIVSVDGHLYYQNNTTQRPWRYLVKAYAEQKESDYTISLDNKFDPKAGETYKLIYNLYRNSFVNISIYNVRGELIRILVNEDKNVGKHFVIWDGKNDYEKYVALGLYLINVQTADYTDTRKIILTEK